MPIIKVYGVSDDLVASSSLQKFANHTFPKEAALAPGLNLEAKEIIPLFQVSATEDDGRCLLAEAVLFHREGLTDETANGLAESIGQSLRTFASEAMPYNELIVVSVACLNDNIRGSYKWRA